LLRRRAAAGDIAAALDLALDLLDGIQDRQGHSVVRRNSPFAVRLLQYAADNGKSSAATMLAYAYDVGKGVRRNDRVAIRWYHRAVRQGESLAAANLATVYRDKGNLRGAHHWHLRAMEMGDGDAAVDTGYDYLYGIGVRKDLRLARHMFQNALQSTDISQLGREEALYHLAVAEIDYGSPRLAIPLLRTANKDGNYPEAASLLAEIESKTTLTPCRCRRALNKNLRGHAKCPRHPANGRFGATKGKR
jgi:TPR repeat protein